MKKFFSLLAVALLTFSAAQAYEITLKGGERFNVTEDTVGTTVACQESLHDKCLVKKIGRTWNIENLRGDVLSEHNHSEFTVLKRFKEFKVAGVCR